MAQGSTVVEAGSQIRVTRKTSYRWRDEYGSTRKWLGRVGAKTLYKVFPVWNCTLMKA